MNSFLSGITSQFVTYKKLGDNSFSQLEEADFYIQPRVECNSISVIVQHISGNMISRWTDILTTDGEKPWRKRDEEFEEKLTTLPDLLNCWESGWACLFTNLEKISIQNLEKTIYIRQEAMPLVVAITRQLSHASYHVGQIVVQAKMIKGNNWKSLSIPKGASETFNKEMIRKKQ